ncbi:hypothetical protein LJR251_002745 [Rhizobium rhizogenes]|uniref:hypothetical protein n=1 Tax=Rhizobium rhizogenes TaxID=359 RepID=UPI003ECD58AA
MTVKMIVGIAGADFSLSPGEQTDRFSENEEARLIAAGHAVRSAPSKVERAVKPAAREIR